jgi:cation diffusion facilitator CzcD-associated flavoprotein CzcO
VRIPTATTLEKLTGGDRALALKVRRVLDGRLMASNASEAAARWAASRHHHVRATSHELILEACNDLLDGCGVEAIRPNCDPQHYDEGIRMCPAYSYVNTGDSYALTLVRDHEDSCWRVMSWADAVDRHEKNCSACRDEGSEDS